MKSMQNRTKIIVATLAIVGAVLYVANLKNPLYGDDIPLIIENSRVQEFSFSSVKALLTHTNAEGSAGIALQYRPITMASFAANVRLSGAVTTSYHVVNDVLHILNAILLFFVVRLLLASRTISTHRRDILSAVIAAFWLIHPLQTEAVSNIAGRGDLLAFFFEAIGLYLVLKGKSWRWSAATIFAMALALLSHESAILFPVYATLALLMVPSTSSPFRSSLSAALGVTWPLYALAAVYGAIHTIVLNLPSSFVGYALTHGSAVLSYLKLVIIPVGLHPERTIPMLPLWAAWVGIAVVMGGIAGALRQWRRGDRIAVFGVALAILPLALSFGFSSGTQLRILEHWLYLPLVGLALLVVVYGDVLYQMLRAKSRIVGIIFFVLVVAYVLVLCAQTVRQNVLWGQPEKLLMRITSFEPEHTPTLIALATLYAQQEKFDLAEKYLLTASALSPSDAGIFTMLGNLKRGLGAMDQAIMYYEKAIAADPSSSYAYRNLAGIYIQRGNNAKALPLLLELEELTPQDVAVHYAVAQLYLTAGKRTQALQALERGIPYLQTPDAAAAYEQLLRKLQ